MREYDAIADWYASERSTEIGVPEALDFAALLPQGARVLDLGCGNGVPITRALLEAGCRVVGLDSSSLMLARFHANCPETAAVRGLAQQCAFADRSFDGAIAWGTLCHLDPVAQKTTIAGVCRVLKAGAPFLFTAGAVDDADGGTEGTMNGVAFRYYSFGVQGYGSLLGRNGFVVLNVHTGRGDHTYYLARKGVD